MWLVNIQVLFLYSKSLLQPIPVFFAPQLMFIWSIFVKFIRLRFYKLGLEEDHVVICRGFKRYLDIEYEISS